MLKKLIKMIGKKIGIKDKKSKTTESSKGPVQQKSFGNIKYSKKPSDTQKKGPEEGEKDRYKGTNRRPDYKKSQSTQGRGTQPERGGKPQSQRPPRTSVTDDKHTPRTSDSENRRPPRTSDPDNRRTPRTSDPDDRNRPPQRRQPQEGENKQRPRGEQPFRARKPHEGTTPQSQKPQEGTAPRQHKPHVEKPKRIIDNDWNESMFPVADEEGKMRFQEFGLSRDLMHAIADLGFKYCTPIQQEILHKSLAGNDAIGQAQTGTGKTAAFLITILTRLEKDPITEERRPGQPRSLIIAPTRELVMQIAKDAEGFAKYMDINVLAVYGGMDYKKQQAKLMDRPVDIIIATPGRLIDFYNRKELLLNKVEIMVIDEADRMLDMGFIPDVKKIIRATPPKEKRQTLFFSATIDIDVMNLAASWTTDSISVKIEPDEVVVKNIDQKIYITTSDKKYPLLYNLITLENLDKVLVFTNRKDEARNLATRLYKHGIECDILTGDVIQRKRIKTLEDFRNGIVKILVATDVAGRGIHVESISHVINYTLPDDPGDYVHRVGRTGRAGAAGISISFATEDDSFEMPIIEEYIGRKLDYTYPDEKYLVPPPPYSREAKNFGLEGNANRYKGQGNQPNRRGPKPSGSYKGGNNRNSQGKK